MKKSVGLLLARAFAYMLFVAGLVYLITLEGYRDLAASEYAEGSITERLQSLSAILSSACFLLVARFSTSLRPVSVMLAALTCMMFIREADFFLDAYLFDGAWQALVALILVVAAVYLWSQPHSIGESIQVYAQQPSAGILLSGILVTFVFSRLFGRASFWEAVMGEGYLRVVKNIAEEGTELLGYGLIVIAALELLFLTAFGSRKASGS